MRHLCEPLQRAKELRPFAAEWRQLLLPSRSQAVATAPTSVGARFPCAANPVLVLHAVEHGIQSREGEVQRAIGLLFDAASQLIAVQRAILKNAEDRKFGSAPLDSRTNHNLLPYI